MKKYYWLCLLIFFFSCKEGNSRSVTNPDEVGKQVFKILTGLESMSLDEYKKNIITYQDLQALANDTKAPIGGYNRGNLKSITQEEYDEVMSKEYGQIRAEAKSLGIQWDKVSFVNFKSRIQEDLDNKEGKILLGETYFKNQDGKIYFTLSASFFDGTGYKLVKVNEIHAEKNKEY